MLKLILFDFHKTLGFDICKISREELFSFYQNLGIDLSKPEKLKEFSKAFGRLIGYSRSWMDFSQKFLKELKISNFKEKTKTLADFYQKNFSYQLYDDVKEVIDLPFKKGILTAQARFLIEHLHLENWAELFTPLETKFLKPDPRAFLVPLEKFKTKPEEAFMVGDELERDIKPAKELGMGVALIDRENSVRVEDTSIHKICSLGELKNILMAY